MKGRATNYTNYTNDHKGFALVVEFVTTSLPSFLLSHSEPCRVECPFIYAVRGQTL